MTMYKNTVRKTPIVILATLIIVIFNSCAQNSTPEITSPLHGVAIINKTHGFAVGDSGVIIEYKNGSWSVIDSPTEHKLCDISMVSNTFGFAVGANGTILKYNGVSWNIFDSPIQSDLYAVSMVNNRLGFAIGEELYKFTGQSWLKQEGVVYAGPVDRDIDMHNETFGMIVEGSDSYIYNGTNWSQLVIDMARETDIEDVCIINDSIAFAVGFDMCAGGGVVYKYNGNSWTLVCCNSKGVFKSISMIDERWGFIVGHDFAGNGKIWKFDGVKCTTVAHPVVKMLWDVEVIDATFGFAVGDNGTILKWNGKSWNKENISTTD